MPRRSYQQACSLARALDAVGERWTLLVVRELLLGPLRYGEIHDRLPGMGTNLLADRLKTMEKIGLVERTPADNGHRWSLTEAGRGLEPALMELIRWAMKTRLPSRSGEINRPEWDLVAMKALYRKGPGVDTDGRYQLVLNGVPAILEVRDGQLDVHCGRAEAPAAVIGMDSATGWQLATGSLTQAQALRDGRLTIHGERERAARLLGCFRAW